MALRFVGNIRIGDHFFSRVLLEHSGRCPLCALYALLPWQSECQDCNENCKLPLELQVVNFWFWSLSKTFRHHQGILGYAYGVPCMLCFRGRVSFKIVTRPRLQSHFAGAQIVMFSIIVTPQWRFLSTPSSPAFGEWPLPSYQLSPEEIHWSTATT